ncbi:MULTISPECIES: GAF domain-containing protein [unclassified Nocardia]|uniref:GAF domain-containing protein n=1 Tax=unclassified Nocardia TaxID=2637762 RepID=UPI0027E09AFF|nr:MULTISPECIES: GAF domain-containing protein [unclassified Nocardia]
MIETLTGAVDQVSLVLDHGEPRSFSKLARASLPRSCLDTLVKECFESRCTRDKAEVLDDDRVFRLVGIPILGPVGGVFAVAVWSASILEPLPRLPVIGAVEWTPSGLLTSNPVAEYLLRPRNELPDGRTIPELLRSFDRWDDRAAFLDMFNFRETPADRWIGTAAKRYEDGTYHQFHLAARAVGSGAERRVRAIVCDVTGTAPTLGTTDLTVAALRAIPIPPGHAVALVDLKTAFVHEWLAEEHSPMAGWQHHNPLYDFDGRVRVATACHELAQGFYDRATVAVRVRFTPTDNWVDVSGDWTRIPAEPRPQAILDITPVHPNPPPPVSGCGLCYELTHPNQPADAEQ